MSPKEQESYNLRSESSIHLVCHLNPKNYLKYIAVRGPSPIWTGVLSYNVYIFFHIM